MNQRVLSVLKVLLSGGIIAWLIYKAYSEDQFSAFFEAKKNWWGITAGFACCLAAMIISFIRWNLLVKSIGLPFRLVDSLRIGFIGLFFNLSPVGVVGGDMLRAYYASQHAKHRIPDAVATVFIDRFLGLMTMVTIATIAFLGWDLADAKLDANTLQLMEFMKTVAMVGVLAGGCGIFALVMLPAFQGHAWFQKLARTPLIGRLIVRLTQVVTMYRSRKAVILLAIALSLLVNFFFLLAIYLLANSVLQQSPTFSAHFMIEPIVMVGNAAPLPGGIGGMELAMDALYRVFSPLDSERANGTIVAIGFRFFLLIISLVGGIVWLINRKIIERFEKEKQTDSPDND